MIIASLWLSLSWAQDIVDSDSGSVEPIAVAQPDSDPQILLDAMQNLSVLTEQGFAREGTARVLVALQQFPDHTDAPKIRLALSRAQRDLGLLREEDLILEHGLGVEGWAPWFELAQLDAALQREDFHSLAEAVSNRSEFPVESADAFHFYGAWGRAGVGDERGAKTLLAKVRGPLQPQAQAFSASLDSLTLLRRRRGLAGVLSVVPGAGQLYVGEPGTALTDVVVVGGLGAATGYFVVHEQPVWGAVFGVLAGAGWAAGIEGAIKGAARFNLEQRNLRYEKLRESYWLQADLTDERDHPLNVHTPE